MGKICSFVMAGFREPLTLPQIAGHVAMSPAAFGRFFKRVSRENISVFVNDLRIDYAWRKIVQTSRSITDIAFESGFTTLSSFNGRFLERVGESPRSYRKTFLATIEKGERK